MPDVLRRVGRGGAGNYVTQNGNNTDTRHTDVRDLEAQNLPAPPHVAAQQPQPYARAGRGGAGNFHDAAVVPDETREQIAERSGTAVAAPSAGRSGLTGRGGVGNWLDAPAAQKSDETRRKELADKVVRNVEAELAIPPKVYTPPLKENY